MKLETFLDIYELISAGSKNSISRQLGFKFRKKCFKSVSSNNLIKIAFDTRRIDQETTYNPRRGLQNYHRSEPFISKHMQHRITAFSRLAKVLDNIKNDFGREPEWQDSYARVLYASVQKGLRTKQGDGDFSDAQPSMASLDYLDELIYVRYRLTSDHLTTMAEQELRDIILNKDELLTHGGFSNSNTIITPSDVSKYSYDHMMEKMLSTMAQAMSQMKPADDLTTKLFDVKATKDSPEIERTVTINIKDKLVSNIEKTSEKVNEELEKTSAESENKE